jgi:hypothetical protein
MDGHEAFVGVVEVDESAVDSVGAPGSRWEVLAAPLTRFLSSLLHLL